MAAIKQEVNTPLILTVGVVSALLLLVVTFGLEAWFVREENAEIEAKWRAAPNQWLDAIRTEQQAKIHSTAGWVDDKKTAWRIPIAEAEKAIIKSNGKLPSTQPVKKQQ
jgi:hypothetical protein